eukprot:TRINITY_DN6587_c0_g1_i1.p1 TRINITY_DN6587_c0_g1~~TRINITY_DN6587_c0_g1_i1.p1  ORF type:complete len:234 (-),score=93.98 TRINITY_DN6587_c0_g1_i1:171-824(-)
MGKSFCLSIFESEKKMEFPHNLVSCQGGQPTDPQKLEKLKFIDYVPENKTFKMAEVLHGKYIRRVEEEYKRNVAETVEAFLNEEKAPTTIIPKKANIDLKRYLQPKLDKLSRRTNIAIIELLREKTNGGKPEAQKVPGSVENQKKAERAPSMPFQRDFEGLQAFKMTAVTDDFEKHLNLIDFDEESLKEGEVPDLIEGLNLREKALKAEEVDEDNDD